ncbi:hypothetical protein BTH52_05705 [Lactobacillus delbrueckii subsp. bulgaricus]|nr:hypothetical protein [Lactobacillus delbrueckii subsp. bulgaricus]
MPHSINIATAMYGFRELGAEIVPYHFIDEVPYHFIDEVPYHFIDEIEGQIGPEDIVLDYIEQCQWVLKKFGHPTYMDCYPERLKPFLKRKWVSDPKAVPAAESWVSHDLQDDVSHTLS